MAQFIAAKIEGLDLARLAFKATARELDLAKLRALNESGREARKLSVRALAATHGVAQKFVRKKVQLFRATRKRDHARLWAGLKTVLATARQVPKLAKSVKSAFRQTMPRGFRSTFVRKPAAATSMGVDSKGRPKRNRLPIEEVSARLVPADQNELAASAAVAMRGYVHRIRRDLKFRLNKRRR